MKPGIICLPAAGSPPAKLPVIRLFNQGRKFGVGCLIRTQSSRLVDYTVFGNCSTKIVGRLEAAQDVERVREWFSTSGAPAWLDGRKGSENRNVRWPVAGNARRIREGDVHQPTVVLAAPRGLVTRPRRAGVAEGGSRQ